MFWIASGFVYFSSSVSAVVLHEFRPLLSSQKLLGISELRHSSVGIRPRLFGRKFGHTDYRVSAIPPEVRQTPVAMDLTLRRALKAPLISRQTRCSTWRPRYQRIHGGVSWARHEHHHRDGDTIHVCDDLWRSRRHRRRWSGYVTASGAADQAGLKPGDRIISFNGTVNPTWDSI